MSVARPHPVPPDHIYTSLTGEVHKEPAALSQNFGLPPIGPTYSMDPQIPVLKITDIITDVPPPDP